MVRVDMEGLFPASRDKFWKLMDLHLDEVAVRAIHPGIVSQKILTRERGEATFEREWRLSGRTWKATWKYELAPPEKYRFDILSSEGPVGKGSFLENKYAEAPGGTLVSTHGEMILQGVPRFMQGIVVKRTLNRIDREDLNYLRKMARL